VPDDAAISGAVPEIFESRRRTLQANMMHMLAATKAAPRNNGSAGAGTRGHDDHHPAHTSGRYEVPEQAILHFHDADHRARKRRK
jgi:hypothetical protein